MTSIRGLAWLNCARCGEQTLHSANVCTREGCGEVNTASGNAPLPRPSRPYGCDTMKAKQYNPRQAAQAEARRRARQARQHLRGVGTK